MTTNKRLRFDTLDELVDSIISLLPQLSSSGAVLTPRVSESLKPQHKCVPLASAVMDKGRCWWVGRLLAPVPEWPKETHCLHMKTPIKDVVFLCNGGDFEQLLVLSNVVVELQNLDWLNSVTEGAKRRSSEPHHCPHCGRSMKSDFDPDVGMWYECENCAYMEPMSSNAPVSSSERRCGKCDHADAIDPHGRCMSVYYDAGGSLVYCGCKCVFPASTKETVEQFERDFAAWQRKMNESIEATRQSEILTAEDFNIRINARADDPALAMAPAPKEHIVECGVWTDPATAEIDRLTSELKAVQERAASEISELAGAVIDLEFELHNAGFQIEQLNAEVARLTEDLKVGELCEECEQFTNEADGNPRTFVICGVCWNKQQTKLSTARADAIDEALMAMEDLRKAYPESVFTRHLLNVVIAALETLKQKESSFQK